MRKLFLAILILCSPAFAQTTAPSTSKDDETARLAPKHSRYDAAISPKLKTLTAMSGHLLVQASVNGKDVGWFIFDTGAGISYIDKSVADELKLAESGGITARGTSGDSESKLRKFNSLSVGPVIVEEGVMLELNLKPYALAMGAQIAGIIGHDCFDAAVFDIDLPHGTISAFDPATYKLEPADGSWRDMKQIARRPAIDGSIEGGPMGLFTLDIGANEGVLVHAPTVKSQNLLEGRKTSTALNGGVGGMKAVRRGKLKSITLAGVELKDVPAMFSESNDGLSSSDEVMATIGLEVLQQFRIIINQPAMKIAMIREAPTKSPTTQKSK